MDLMLYLRAIAALAVVLGLIALVAYFVRRAGWAMPGATWRDERRLGVVESLNIDQKRRLLLVQCDGQEHLVLLGTQNEIVLNSQTDEAHVRTQMAASQTRIKAAMPPVEPVRSTMTRGLHEASAKPIKPPLPSIAAKSEKRILRREPILDGSSFNSTTQ